MLSYSGILLFPLLLIPTVIAVSLASVALDERWICGFALPSLINCWLLFSLARLFYSKSGQSRFISVLDFEMVLDDNWAEATFCVFSLVLEAFECAIPVESFPPSKAYYICK